MISALRDQWSGLREVLNAKVEEASGEEWSGASERQAEDIASARLLLKKFVDRTKEFAGTAGEDTADDAAMLSHLGAEGASAIKKYMEFLAQEIGQISEEAESTVAVKNRDFGAYLHALVSTFQIHVRQCECSRTRSDADTEIRDLKKRMLDMKQELEDEKDDLLDEIETLKSEKEDLLVEVETARILRKQLKELEREHEDTLMKLRSENAQLRRELRQQRDQLLSIEEAYSSEAKLQEDKIAALRNELSSLSKSRTPSDSFDTRLQDVQKQLIQERMRREESERIRKEAEAAKNHLLTIIKGFEHEKRESSDQELNEARRRAQSAEQKIIILEKQLAVPERIQSVTTIELQEELEARNCKIKELEKQIMDAQQREISLKFDLQRVATRLKSEEHYVDKRLVVSMLIAFIERPESRRDIVRVMANILQLSEQERQRIGADEVGSGWLQKLSGWVSGALSERPLVREGQTIADAWVDFLLREAGEDAEVDMAVAGETITEASLQHGEVEPP